MGVPEAGRLAVLRKEEGSLQGVTRHAPAQEEREDLLLYLRVEVCLS